MPFYTRGAPVMGEETVSPSASLTAEPGTTTETELEQSAVEEAIRVIQKHIDKEARNRWVEHLEVRDLCPRQKADMISDLAKLF
jgi:hypothetical protein